MKIQHVITTLDVGGAEMHLLSQVRGQAERGHSVSVAYLKGQGTLAGDFRAAGAERVEHVGSGPGLLKWLFGAMRSADIVHSHLLKADMACAAVAPLARAAGHLVASKHNDEQVLRKALVSRIHGVLGGVPKRTIVLSEHVRRFIEEHGRVRADRTQVIYYGLDPAPFEEARAVDAAQRRAGRAEFGVEADEIVFTCVARFAPQKAHDVLLRAFHQAAQRAALLDPPQRLRMLLVGDDPFGDGRERAEAIARDLGLGERVLFLGIRRDVPALLGFSDVFVMSSLWEGLGLVFLEAMACGLPVLATNVSAIPEVVDPTATGILVPPSDDAALAEAMLRLSDDAGLRSQLGEAGHRRVIESFGLEKMVAATLEVYEQVLAEERNGR